MNADFRRTHNCVKHYRKLGLCPLPSRMDKKGPTLDSYAAHFGPTPVPTLTYSDWETTNVQLITGTKSPALSKIIVVDCDGEGSLDVWLQMCAKHNFSTTSAWIARTGGGGWHFYFSLPISTASCPGGMVWGQWDTWGDNGIPRWTKHKEVRILADNALVVAPPSIHVDTGVRYAFEAASSPNTLRLPGFAPEWLIRMPRLAGKARCYPEPPPKPVSAPRKYPQTGNWYRREDVLNALGDRKLAVAKGWGLITSSDAPNPSGWVACFVPSREEPGRSDPSGSFHFTDGTLQDRRDLTSISLFDLGVQIGGYRTWQECRDDLGDRFIGKLR